MIDPNDLEVLSAEALEALDTPASNLPALNGMKLPTTGAFAEMGNWMQERIRVRIRETSAAMDRLDDAFDFYNKLLNTATTTVYAQAAASANGLKGDGVLPTVKPAKTGSEG